MSVSTIIFIAFVVLMVWMHAGGHGHGSHRKADGDADGR